MTYCTCGRCDWCMKKWTGEYAVMDRERARERLAERREELASEIEPVRDKLTCADWRLLEQYFRATLKGEIEA